MPAAVVARLGQNKSTTCLGYPLFWATCPPSAGYVGSDLDARHEQKRRRLNCHTLPEDRRRSTCVQTNGISASVLASGVFRGATLLIEKRSLCRQIRSGRVCKIRAVVLTCDVGPNITGQANLSNGWGGVADNGALKRQGRTDAPGGGAANGTNLQFDASWSSSIYRVNSTVQPASIRLIPSIKT